jgi:hypothetical protein
MAEPHGRSTWSLESMRIAALDLRITAAAAARIAASRPGADLTPALLRAHTSDGGSRWSTGWYGPDQLRGLESTLEASGHPLLYDCAGTLLCIPQAQVFDCLRGRVLDATEAGFTVS